MTINATTLARECAVFSTYLIGIRPTEYIQVKYVEAHRWREDLIARDRVDRVLIRLARTHPVLTRCADSYSRFLLPESVMRKKLVVMLALLETSFPACKVVDQVASAGLLRVSLRLSLDGALMIAGLVMIVAILGPIHFAIRLLDEGI